MDQHELTRFLSAPRFNRYLGSCELGFLLSQGTNVLMQAARRARRSTHRRTPPGHDDVVAHLSFGTWYSLLPGQQLHSGQRQVLWEEAIAAAFPERHQVPARAIRHTVHAVYDVRNRVAHFEPIYDLYLAGKRSAMVRLLHMIDRPMKNWFMEVERFSDEIERFVETWPTVAVQR
ncbi:hypothetical protein ACXR2W_06430 [Leucobacter sp. HY1908]